METEKPRTNLIAALEDRGYRATAPRKAVAKLLEQKQKGFTVEALSEELPSVALPTEGSSLLSRLSVKNSLQ